jgi:hypothetical protein
MVISSFKLRNDFHVSSPYHYMCSQVLEATTKAELEVALSECDWRFEIGDSMGNLVTLEDKRDFVERAVKYFLIIQPQAMIREFMDGLMAFEVSSFIPGFVAT